MKITKKDLKNIIKSILNESRFENMTQVEFFNVNVDELSPEEEREYLEDLRRRSLEDGGSYVTDDFVEPENQVTDDFVDAKLPSLDTNIPRRKFIKGGIIAAAIAAGSSFFSSLFDSTTGSPNKTKGTIVNDSSQELVTRKSIGRYHDTEDLIMQLKSRGYDVSIGDIIPLSQQVQFNNEENDRQGWSEDENMNRLFKYLSVWLSYQMPELGILTVEDMLDRNIAYTSESSDAFYFGVFFDKFKEDKIASEFLGKGGSKGQFSSHWELTTQAAIPEDAAIDLLGFHPDYLESARMPNGHISLFEKVKVGTFEGFPVVVFTEDAFDHIIFLK